MITFKEFLFEAEQYKKELSKLVPLPNHAYKDKETLKAHLHRALKAEKQRGQSNHWSYDLGRHQAMLNIYKKLDT